MGQMQSRWDRPCRGVLVGALGCCLLTGCTLVSRDWFGLTPEDAGAMEGGLDAAVPTVTEFDTDGARPRSAADRPAPTREKDSGAPETPDAGSAAAPDAGSEGDADPDRQPDAGEAPDAEAPPPKDAGPQEEPDPGVGPGEAEQPPASGEAPEEPAEPVEPATDAEVLIDAIDAEGEARTDRYCSCPGTTTQCALSGFEGTSCEEWGLNLLSNGSQAGVVALLTCLLTAEEAYTECVDREFSCEASQTSVRGCSRTYETATTRCNNTSFTGLSIQQLCSR